MNQGETDVIIIGAGIAGLSAGCYAQMNGLTSRIFELHTQPGGLCTSWKRKGYTFDYCIHWLVGSSPKNGFHRIWQELGLVQGRQFLDHDIFTQVENADGRRIVFYIDPKQLQQHLTTLFPADAAPIAEMCRAIRVFSGFQMAGFSLSPRNLARLIRSIPSFRLMKRYGSMTMKQFAERFSDPWLREVMSSFFGMEDMPAIGFLMSMGWMASGCAGYPIGGSLPMAQAVAERYRFLGGQIRYGARVAKILTEGEQGAHACGVRLEDGSEHRARWVISAADAHATFKNMLDDQFPEPTYERYFAEKRIFPSLIQVSLGIDGSLDVPQSISFPLAGPISVDPGAGGKENRIERMDLHHYAFDPTLAPKGKTVAVVRFAGTPEYWRNLAGSDRATYEKEKTRILESVISGLEQRFPGTRARIEVTDVATPWSAERYTGNWDGCMEGWRMTPESLADSMQGKGLKKTLPELANFALIGQWTAPGGGLPPSAQSGRDIMKVICRAEGRKFRTTIPAAAKVPGAVTEGARSGESADDKTGVI